MPFDTLVEVRVSATNSQGTSTVSSVNTSGARTRRAPAAMAAPVKVSGDQTQISLSWTALTSSADTGNSAITAYQLYWDNGSGTTSQLVYSGTATTATVTGLSSGTNYKFKVRAENVYGYGSYSSEVTISASTVPGTVSSITSAYATYPNVDITWSAPSSNGGSTITKYQVLIWSPAANGFVEDTTNCDGT